MSQKNYNNKQQRKIRKYPNSYILAIFFLNANTEGFSFMIDRRNIYTRMLITLHHWLYCIDIAAIISSFLLHDPKYCVMHSPFNFSYCLPILFHNSYKTNLLIRHFLLCRKKEVKRCSLHDSASFLSKYSLKFERKKNKPLLLLLMCLCK